MRKITFWNRFCSYIEENTFNPIDETNTRRIIYCYLTGEKGFDWDKLTLNVQEILIGFETEMMKEKKNYRGLVPDGAQLRHACYF